MRLIIISLVIIFITGWQNPPFDYAYVDDTAVARGWHTTIQSALNSGATTIEIRDGEYPESVVIDRPLTILCREGATILNNGAQVSIWVNAPNVTVKGCLIKGEHTGGALGDMFNGTGVLIQASNTHLDGLHTLNLRSFSVLNPTNGANSTILENFYFRNIATNRDAHLCAGTAIQFIASNSRHIVRNGFVTGYSQAGGLWYGVRNSLVQGNRFIDNYGWIGENCDGSRSAVEDYGLAEGNVGNRYFDNYIDGSNSHGFELADVLHNTVVSRNTTRNTYRGAFVVMGSGSNRGTNITIEDNTFYGTEEGWTNWFSGTGVIRDNRFIDYVSNGIGTIYRPADSVGELLVESNEFIGNGRVIRITKGDIRFIGNTVESIYTDSIFVDGGVSGVWIEGNQLRGNNIALNTDNGREIVLRGNQIEGWLNIWTSTGILIQDNEIYIPTGAWTAFQTAPQSRILDNHIMGDTPYVVAGQYVLVEGNYITKSDGSPVAIPPCSTDSTCRNNYTVGQVP